MSMFARFRHWIRHRLRRENDVVTSCRALRPSDWHHLHTADAVGTGVVLVASGEPETVRTVAERWLDIAHEATTDDARTRVALGEGCRVLIVSEPGRDPAALATRLADETGCVIVPLTIIPAGDRLDLRVGEPLVPEDHERASGLFTRVDAALSPRS